jgi:hypothetical protein
MFNIRLINVQFEEHVIGCSSFSLNDRWEEGLFTWNFLLGRAHDGALLIVDMLLYRFRHCLVEIFSRCPEFVGKDSIKDMSISEPHIMKLFERIRCLHDSNRKHLRQNRTFGEL